MKIANARVIITCPGRNFVTLKIETGQGVHGIGDAAASLLRELVTRKL